MWAIVFYDIIVLFGGVGKGSTKRARQQLRGRDTVCFEAVATGGYRYPLAAEATALEASLRRSRVRSH